MVSNTEDEIGKWIKQIRRMKIMTEYKIIDGIEYRKCCCKTCGFNLISFWSNIIP